MLLLYLFWCKIESLEGRKKKKFQQMSCVTEKWIKCHEKSKSSFFNSHTSHISAVIISTKMREIFNRIKMKLLSLHFNAQVIFIPFHSIQFSHELKFSWINIHGVSVCVCEFVPVFSSYIAMSMRSFS